MVNDLHLYNFNLIGTQSTLHCFSEGGAAMQGAYLTHWEQVVVIVDMWSQEELRAFVRP